MIMLIVSDTWQYIPPTFCSVLGVSTPHVVLLSSGPCVLWMPVKGTVLWLLCLELVMQGLPGICICRYRLDIACPGLARSAEERN